MTITLEWKPDYGYVAFDVRSATVPGWTLKRLDLFSSRLIGIVGFEDDTWLDGTGAGYGEDYRPPLGATVTYVLAPVNATADDLTYQRASVVVPGGQAWLRDTAHPSLARAVTVISTGDESLPAYQHVYDISGRRLALVVHDVRTGRRGTVSLYVPDRDERLAMETLLASGNPLLLTACNDVVWAPCMMAVGDAVFTRYGKGAAWTLDLDYIEVDDPLTYFGERIADVIWQDVIDGVPAQPGDPDPVDWTWVKAEFVDWLALVAGERAD